MRFPSRRGHTPVSFICSVFDTVLDNSRCFCQEKCIDLSCCNAFLRQSAHQNQAFRAVRQCFVISKMYWPEHLFLESVVTTTFSVCPIKTSGVLCVCQVENADGTDCFDSWSKFEVEKFSREIDSYDDPQQLRDLAKDLLLAWKQQQASTAWVIVRKKVCRPDDSVTGGF